MDEPMKTTLCYIVRDGRWLLMLRDKKENDASEGKWIGPGGKVEPGETPDECMLREVREETGFELTEWQRRGVIQFKSDRWPDEEMHIYTATGFKAPSGTPKDDQGAPLPECNEGTFAWIPDEQLLDLPLWEGDKIFLRALQEGKPDISMELTYQSDELVSVKRAES